MSPLGSERAREPNASGVSSPWEEQGPDGPERAFDFMESCKPGLTHVPALGHLFAKISASS